MAAPKLSTRNSGFSGRGYKNVFEEGQPVVPSVTTVLKVLDKPGIVQWAVDNTAAYAVANVDALLARDEVAGFGLLRWYHGRFKPQDFDDPETDIRNYHVGVLNDLAELGTNTHNWIEANLQGWIEPEIMTQAQEEMVEEFLMWKLDQDIEVYATEASVFGDGYAGTADIFGKLNGVNMCLDTKTGRNIYDEATAQIAALGAAHTMAVEVGSDTPGAFLDERKDQATTFWLPKPLPSIQAYGILHVRPNDTDTKGNFVPAFCRVEAKPQAQVDIAWELFQSALGVVRARAALNGQKKLDDVEW